MMTPEEILKNNAVLDVAGKRREEIRALTRRVTGIEVATTRMQAALAGFSQVLQQTAGGAVSCAKCENDITGMKTCAVEECPCGFPATLETEDPPPEE